MLGLERKEKMMLNRTIDMNLAIEIARDMFSGGSTSDNPEYARGVYEFIVNYAGLADMDTYDRDALEALIWGPVQGVQVA